MSGTYTYGLIGLTEENVGIDRRFYTGLTNAANNPPTLAVSYNAGRVDVFLNGIKLVGDHSGNTDYDYTMDSTTGTGSTVTLTTGVAFVASDVVECVGYVSNSSNTITSYNPTPANADGGWNVFASINHTASDLVNVFLNGVLLDDSDYTLDATNNKVTILGATLTASDVVVIQVIGALDHSNFVPASGGTFSGNVVFSGNTTGLDVNGTELVLDADGDTSITADTDDQIDIKIGGTDVGNFNSDTLKLTKDNTPKLIVEDTNSTDFTLLGNTFWLTAPELQLTHNTSDANADGAIGNVKFQGTTKNNLGIASSNQTIAQIEGRAFEASAGVGQRVTDMKSGFRFKGYDGAGNFGDLMIIKGETLQIQNGGGIDFGNVSGSAGGSTSALLDDYEEGTWTPIVNNNSNSEGSYTKIGRLVNVNGIIGSTDITSGEVDVTGLPFPVANLNSATGHEAQGSISHHTQFKTGKQCIGVVAQDGGRLDFRLLSAIQTRLRYDDHSASTWNVRFSVTYATT